MSSYKLSICIPTYDRAHLLKRACVRLIERISEEGFSDDIQICISSNGSTDGTEEVVRWLQTQFGSIKYRRNEENTGFSRNLLSVIEMADGQYVLPAADDDLIRHETLNVIFDALQLGYEIVLFGSWMDSRVVDRIKSDSPPMRIKNAIDAVETLGPFHLAAISNFVVRRDVYLKHHKQSFLSSAYPQTCVLLMALRDVEAVFIRTAIFEIDDSYRQLNQPLLTSIDMSEVHSECVFSFGAPRESINRIYTELVRSVPRAILRERKGLAVRNRENPYANLSIGNLLHCYRYSIRHQLIGASFWLVSRLMPLRILERLVERR